MPEQSSTKNHGKKPGQRRGAAFVDDDDGVDSRARQAYRTAQMYYLQDMTMGAIARDLGTSRSTVSRLLSLARETGLIQLQLTDPHEQAPRLELQIQKHFGVRAHIVPIFATLDGAKILDRVAMQAARTLGPLLDSEEIIGIAWGSTVSAVSRHLVPKKIHDGTVVQLNGAGNTRTSGIAYASEILRRFSGAFNLSVEQFPVPAFFDYPSTKSAMWKERSVQRILDYQERMTTAVFGLGSVGAEIPSHVYTGDYLDRTALNGLEEDGVVGDAATIFFRADGSDAGIEINQRSSGPPLDLLRSTPRRVCVVSGQAKIQGLLGALNAGLPTDIVLDDSTARLLVRKAGITAS
ncbi:sugar-binding transcriptional regulator [Nesterenkonia salmonea]|uniref:Sugar-binding transcriptional regulator n=2 Tax=Nesterenkonia salmonea TaxID=1804987 RepID=A0A5R9B8Y9_9MICC|nr:sugar-binding domain-containing protein [Nesterenkonia salmonea]TLP94881.1 sugar-binding transcriptional regulator [Nesterenkonia salmonea]